MALERWEPLRELMRMREEIDRLFDEVLQRHGGGIETLTRTGWKPPLDVIELPDRYLVRADVPGVPARELELHIEEGTLVLRGERQADPAIPEEAYLRRERSRGRFALQISLPPSVDTQGARASHRDGVLEVVLPKRAPEAAGRTKVPVE